MASHYICTDLYTVQAGDTLYAVSQKYNVDVNLLMRANRIRNPYNLKIGTRLCIPGLQEEAPAAAPLPEVPQDVPQDGASSPDTTPVPEQQPGKPQPGGQQPQRPPQCRLIHVIREGDTLYMIAKEHHVTLEALMAANPSIDPYNMQIGAEICIP